MNGINVMIGVSGNISSEIQELILTANVQDLTVVSLPTNTSACKMGVLFSTNRASPDII